jgi:hypothetical protein
MRRVNTRGLELANKHVLMAALAYNLKKYLKFVRNDVDENAAFASIPVMGWRDNMVVFFYLIFSTHFTAFNNYIVRNHM